jgi:predicted ATPase
MHAPSWQQLIGAPAAAGARALPGLLLMGPVGVGKTWLAAAAAWALLETLSLHTAEQAEGWQPKPPPKAQRRRAN